MSKLFGIGALAVAITASGAFAQVWAEVGDAGELVGTAQVTGGGVLTSITGALTTGDADMYLITINTPTSFSASTVGGAAFDSQLFLFTSAGVGIAFNDDAGPLQSALTVGNPLYASLAAGQYLLAVSGFNHDPTSAGGAIFPDSFPGIFGPTGPGGGSPVTGWTAAGASGTYTIALTGVRAAPGPASLALIGLAGFAARRRRA
jgi:MYXO-CTERM domain-containing protein